MTGDDGEASGCRERTDGHDEPRVGRRELLTALTATTATAGCLAAVDNGPNCTLGAPADGFSVDGVDAVSFGHTSSNVRYNPDGSCDRWGNARCVEARLWLEDEVPFDTVEGRTSDGTVLARADVDEWLAERSDRGRPTGAGTSGEGGQPSDEDQSDEGIGDEPGGRSYDDAIVLELATLEYGDEGAFEVVALANGTKLESATISFECDERWRIEAWES